ncbi:Holliday junction resolvase RuvX [Immundisolibacter sp.]|uniref:Holliday junction resolvase RuvX n=1 Tax=Immundisolibacter sp. TaxID=1934948 RepID=UPI003568DD6B
MSGLVLGFDYGQKRVGVATGQALTGTATPLTTLVNPQFGGWGAFDALLAQWRPQTLVVGLPLAADGSDTTVSQAARRFATELGDRSGLAVALIDERLSSHEAEARLAADGRRPPAMRERRDAVAAAIIVETWLAEHAH